MLEEVPPLPPVEPTVTESDVQEIVHDAEQDREIEEAVETAEEAQETAEEAQETAEAAIEVAYVTMAAFEEFREEIRGMAHAAMAHAALEQEPSAPEIEEVDTHDGSGVHQSESGDGKSESESDSADKGGKGKKRRSSFGRRRRSG